MKNYGTLANSSVAVGLSNRAQLNLILRKHHSENPSFKMAPPLLPMKLREISPMPLNNVKEADLPGQSRRQPDCQVEDDEKTKAESSGPVIELADLSTGAEADVGRLKSSLIALSGEIGQIRSEHVGLAADYQKLTGELRDIKLVLAKVHAKELRGIERRGSWMESLRRLREMFQKSPHSLKNHKAKSSAAFLRK